MVLQMALLTSSLERLESMSVLTAAAVTHSITIYSTVHCHYLVGTSQSVFEMVPSVPCDKIVYKFCMIREYSDLMES